MITHFAAVELSTVSVEGARQVYAERLGFSVVAEGDDRVTFRVAPFTTLTFVERNEPISPAHLAFHVPYSTFPISADLIRRQGILTARLPGADAVIEDDEGAYQERRLYFRDGDGNLLEIIAFSNIAENVLAPHGPLNVLFLREIGFPVHDVPAFCTWLQSNFGMAPRGEVDRNFTFVGDATARAVVVARARPWIPIAMKALSPPLKVVLGTPDRHFVEMRDHEQSGRQSRAPAGSTEVQFEREGYFFSVRYDPDFPADLPHRLRLKREAPS